MSNHESTYPVLKALTPEAGRAIGGAAIVIPQFPFRIGRESRIGSAGLFNRERRAERIQPANNDLYLLESGKKKNVSREHLVIDRLENGAFRVYDRGSACGTMVGETCIGGKRQTGECELADGNVIVVGSAGSPFVFKFQINGAQ